MKETDDYDVICAYYRFTDEYTCIIIFRSRFRVWGSPSWRDDDNDYSSFGGVHSCTVFVS